MKHLKRFPEVFTIDKGNSKIDGLDKGWVTLHKSLQSPKDRTERVESVLQVLENEGLIPGWRNEVPCFKQGFFSKIIHYQIQVFADAAELRIGVYLSSLCLDGLVLLMM